MLKCFLLHCFKYKLTVIESYKWGSVHHLLPLNLFLAPLMGIVYVNPECFGGILQ